MNKPLEEYRVARAFIISKMLTEAARAELKLPIEDKEKNGKRTQKKRR